MINDQFIGIGMESKRQKSYVIRQGRLKPSHRTVLNQLESLDCVVEYQGKLITDNVADSLVVEIGFGMGESFQAMAQANPDFQFLGIEVFPMGFASCALKLAKEGIQNAKIIQHDAVDVIEHGLNPFSVDQFNIYQPDPWPKKRHHKRRLLQAGFIQLLASRLKVSGRIHITTDHAEYASSIQQQLDLCSDLVVYERLSGRPKFRPETKYERKGQGKGHEHCEILVHLTEKPSKQVPNSDIATRWPI